MGSPIHSPRFLMKIQKTGALQSRFSVTVPKKVAKLATERNTLRRRVYAAVETFIPSLKPGYEGVIVLKTTIDKIDQKDIISELKNVFLKASLI